MVNPVIVFFSMKILVFLHGTVVMHRAAFGKSKQERIAQIHEKEKSVADFTNYIPINNSYTKLENWQNQGVEIAYLSSNKEQKDLEKDKVVLKRYAFPQGPLYAREKDETYADVVERVMPDVLIEDDCESIGGKKAMVYPNLKKDLQKKITSIVVKEFEGIDHLPDDSSLLLKTA